MDWKTIDTAPKDDDAFILVWDNYHETCEVVRSRGKDWITNYHQIIDRNHITHWMELPKKPKHVCYRCSVFCNEKEGGYFKLESPDLSFFVEFCPFCGKKGR